jgi:hypothetical protein
MRTILPADIATPQAYPPAPVSTCLARAVILWATCTLARWLALRILTGKGVALEVQGLDKPFIVVGENVHCTRILLKKGKRVGESPDGRSAILWTDPDGTQRHLVIPERFLSGNDYMEGRVKHVQIATHIAFDEDDDAPIALDYINYVVQRQVDAGVDFLDVNTDEFGFKHEEQQAAMRFLVKAVQSMTDTPLSIDSSLAETIAAGMETYDHSVGRPLLNSASLERIDGLDLAVKHNSHVIVTGAGSTAMPQTAAERIDHASQMVDTAVAKGIAIEDIQVDLLVFPIAVDTGFGKHYLEAVKAIRDKYGPDIHITGGMSNVSFGIPVRGLVNDVFVNLAIENGADAGIIDPVVRPIQGVVTLDRDSKPYAFARAMLLDEDPGCAAFLAAFRKGELA